jgi:hypothetical protein
MIDPYRGGMRTAFVLAALLGCHGAPPQQQAPEQVAVPAIVDEVQPGDARAGAFARRRDPGNGEFTDNAGVYAGRRDSTGAYYDNAGAFAGRADSTNNYYAPNGTYAGRLDNDGSVLGPNGAYVGRIDVSGNVYDKTGVLVGTTEGNCPECTQDTAARILLER